MTETEREVLRALDFPAQVPCEADIHATFGSGPAVFIARWRQPLPCGHEPENSALCWSCLNRLRGNRKQGIRCAGCDARFSFSTIVLALWHIP